MKKYLLLTMLVALAFSPTLQAQKKSELPDSYNFKRGVEAYNADEYADAASYFEKEVAENSKNGYAHFYLAATHSYLDEEKMTEVFKEINLALKYLPKKDADYRSRAYCLRGRLQAQIGDTVRALDDFAQSIATDLESTRALLDRADIYYAQHDTARTVADYEEALRRDEACTQAWMGLGRQALETKDYATATRHFSRVLRLDPTYGRAYSFRARSHFGQKKYREAAADVISALETSEHADFSSYLTLYQLADSAFVHIETQLRAKVIADNTNAFWLSDLGNIYEYKGRYNQAIATYKKFIETDPVEKASYNVNIARAYMGLYDYREALKYADLAVAADSTDADNIALRGLINYSLDNKAEARADLDRAVTLSPDDASMYSQRAMVRAAYGDKKGGMEDYTTALTIGDEDADNYMHRGRLYQQLGDNAAASRDFEKALRLDTVPSEANAALYANVGLHNYAKAEALNDSVLAHASEAQLDGYYYNSACLYALMGQQDKALDYLQKSFEAGYRDLVHISYDADMDTLRALPRFKELVDAYTIVYRQEQAQEETTVDVATAAYERVTSEVPFARESGIYKVKCTINGLPLHFYFDTGAADVTISSVEAAFMLKNGYLSRADIGGKQYYGNASGEISEGTTINLRRVDFGDLSLTNVRASVVHNQSAPLLLGQTVLSRLGQLEIDYDRSVIKITHLKKK